MVRPLTVQARTLLACSVAVLLAAAVARGEEQTAAPGPTPRQTGGGAKVSAGDGTQTLLSSGTFDERWTTPADRPLASAPAGDGDTAYGATRDGMVVAWELDSGRARWQVPFATSLPVVVGDTRVYVVKDDVVQALAASSGETLWTREVSGVIAAAPYFDTGWLIVSAGGGDVVALRAADGAPQWRASLGATAVLPPASSGHRLYLVLSDARLVALDLASGSRLWSRQLDGAATGLTALSDQLLVGSTAGTLDSLDLADGRPRWRWRTGAGVVAAVAADEKRIFVTAYDHILRALDRRSGNLKWRRALPHRPVGTPVLVGGLVLVPSRATQLTAYDAASGAPAVSMSSHAELSGGTFVRVGGPPAGTRLVALSAAGQILAFSPRVEAPPVPLADMPGVTVTEPAPAAQSPVAVVKR